MKNNKLQEKLEKLVNKKKDWYPSHIDFINALHTIGLSKHCCMILDLIILGRSFERIQQILLFTEDNFKNLLLDLWYKLDSLKKPT